MPLLNDQIDKYFKLVEQVFENNNQYDVYLDDYSQSYVIAYKDRSDNLHTLCCGAYCDYQWDLREIIDSMNLENF